MNYVVKLIDNKDIKKATSLLLINSGL